MSELVIDDLSARVADREVLRGVSLVVRSGEVHAIMGPNGSGKSTLSHVLLGKPGYEVTGGSVLLDGQELLGLPTHERVRAGLFLVSQYPAEVPGVTVIDVMTAALTDVAPGSVRAVLDTEATRVGLDPALLDRAVNVDFSGGEKKRSETVQLAALHPRFAVLDELDSGLDVDALGAVSRRIEALSAAPEPMGVIAITHYDRILDELKADHVHIFVRGRIVESGGPELATRLETSGYAAWAADAEDAPDAEPTAVSLGGSAADPYADPLGL